MKRPYPFRPNMPAPNTPPLVKTLYAAMNAQEFTLDAMAERSGVSRNTFKGWRTRHLPSLDNLQACLNVLGHELVIQPIKESRENAEWQEFHDPYQVNRDRPYNHQLIWVIRNEWGEPQLVSPNGMNAALSVIGLKWAPAIDGKGPPAPPAKGIDR